MEKKEIQRVKLKDGRVMNYLRDKDGRHVFLGDVRVMSVWLMALVIFILVTTILMGFYQITLMVEIGDKLLEQAALTQVACSPESAVLVPTDVSNNGT